MVSSRHRTTLENLPGDILSEIFVRLLAKQLTQMRCVCKPWNALLSESSFIKSHLHHSIHKHDKTLMYFLAECGSYTTRPCSSPDLKLTNFITLPFNTRFKHTRRLVIGSVNGLVCVSYTSYHDSVVHIWNPSLSAVLTLPPCSRKSVFGFGYDPKTDDYKVVKFPRYVLSPNKGVKADVYSMRKGSWKSISQKFPSRINIEMGENQFCLHGQDGHTHWLGWIDGNPKLQTLLSFDLGAETFSEIPLPNAIVNYDVYSSYLRVLGGKLCVISCVDRCEVWVMEEYGVAESWVKHYVFPHFDGRIFPYGFTSRDEFLFRFVHNDHFALYDPVASKTKMFEIISGQRDFLMGRVIEYVDSLVWITPPKRLRIRRRTVNVKE